LKSDQSVLRTSVPVQSPVSESALLDIRAAGQLLGLSYWQVYGLIKTRELPVVPVGTKFYLRRAMLLRWAERAERKA
jgi:excisionase family DNA binding protein